MIRLLLLYGAIFMSCGMANGALADIDLPLFDKNVFVLPVPND